MEAKFLTQLYAKHLGKKWWQLTRPLIYYSEIAGLTIIAPKGFVTDFASVPRFPVAYWLFGSKANAPAVIHDRLYRFGDVPRILADRIFNEAMKVDGKWVTTRWPMTGAVMSCGWASYKTLPGCLDFRGCKQGSGPHCLDCPKYGTLWSSMLIPGCQEVLLKKEL